MKKVIFLVLAIMSLAAQATNNSNPCGNHGNNCNPPPTAGGNGGSGGQGGAGGQGGDGGAGVGLAIAGASSVAEAKANAAAIAAQQQGQQQGQGQAQRQAIRGSGNSGGNKIEGSKTKIDIGGDKYEAAASSVFAAPIPTVATSCRLYMFGGGTNVNGAVSGSIPLGNDQTCLSGVNLNNMLRINQHVANTFSMQDMVKEACKVEGMDTAEPCKKK